ncbi:MAG: TerC/Alx family metal homeostasis membrane protein [Bacteroidetes bacterium]|nr:TerC/Alx family metal homeostasis membrane protein [Bacteroidota bacterium]MCB0842475.1 TerC/Alx family metal homeostasis membrane protein [Bacteroidota bacterium]
MMIWIVLIGLIAVLLAFDLIVLHKPGEAPGHRRVAIETFFWVLTAASFSIAIYFIYQQGYSDNPNQLQPSDAVFKYITGYLIELSLSVDNLFVISMIFASFNIPIKYQHRALFWGIIGAVIFRGLMILFGIVLITKVSWIVYVFGFLLLYTAFRMLVRQEEESDGKRLRHLLSRYFNFSVNLDGEKFRTVENGVKVFTPLFAALIMIELTDLLFALDSIPAILAVTTDPFLVFSSNIFAILGLRSMYFFLANMLEKFHYLKYSVFTILVFVSIKLITSHFIQFPEWFSLTFIGASLLLGILVSLNNLKNE